MFRCALDISMAYTRLSGSKTQDKHGDELQRRLQTYEQAHCGQMSESDYLLLDGREVAMQTRYPIGSHEPIASIELNVRLVSTCQQDVIHK